jgi:LysR family glycine cleavage system transcriptional activator
VSYSRLPPLNALRTFEAVARHRSFRKAAAELFVTPAAVTHQVRLLEEQLGVELFRRLPRRVELTPAAQSALPVLQKAFELMARSVNELRQFGHTPRLTVRASPTFASRWMMPRLRNFLALHQGIDVRVLGGNVAAPQDPGQGDGNGGGSLPQEPDIDIRFTQGRPPGNHVDLLFAVDVVPMCHPRLLDDPVRPLKTPADLRYHPLLHGDSGIEDRSRSIWARWLRQAGVTEVDPRRGLQFDHSTLALDAASDGLGVTLATPAFAREKMARGEIAVAFPISITLDRAYYAIVNPGSAERPEVMSFRQWLLQEAEADTGKLPAAGKTKGPRRSRPSV